MTTVAVYLSGLLGCVALLPCAWLVVRHRVVAVRAWFRRTGDGLTDVLGPIGAPVAIALAGMTLVIAIMWPIGVMLSRQEDRIDRPVYQWMHDRQVGGSLWWTLNDQVSAMGNNDRTKVVIVLLAVVLAIAWRRRGWWIPVVAISATYLGERFTQQVLKDVVHRGHPPTTLGSYPSGGCGRVISVWGIALLLTALHRPRSSHRSRSLLWMALALAAYSQGFSRTFLLKHWLTDVIGGWLFGSAVLVVFGAATVVMVRGRDRRRGHGSEARASPPVTAGRAER